jgi:hypothetical protein
MRAAKWPSGTVMVDPGQQPGRPAADDQVNLGAFQADLAGLLEGDVVVLGQPGQAGDRQVIVALVDGEGEGPLDQPLGLGRDGLLLGKSSGHSETLAHPPDGPAPRSAGKCSPPPESNRRPHPHHGEVVAEQDGEGLGEVPERHFGDTAADAAHRLADPGGHPRSTLGDGRSRASGSHPRGTRSMAAARASVRGGGGGVGLDVGEHAAAVPGREGPYEP